MADPKTSEQLDLQGFRAVSPDAGLSLADLSQGFAQLLGRGADPYAEPEDTPLGIVDDGPDPGEQTCVVSPRSILEGLLFVGNPQNVPLSAEQAASLMRGVRPAEIDQAVRELNADYTRLNCPYQVIDEGGGYRLVLRPKYHRLRDKLLGRARQARLSTAAIEVLSLVAYNQPVLSEDVDRARGSSSGAILAQLVRRQLLRLERAADEPRKPRYYTTGRFLQLFGLSSLDELPRSQELETQ